MPAAADKYDEIRRQWIARNQRTFIFQKRRAEILARDIRRRDGVLTGARPDPADDDVIHPWYMRPVNTPYAMLDWAIFMSAAVLAPAGWPLGKLMSITVVQLIPGELRSYPIAGFMWSAAIVGLPLPMMVMALGPSQYLDDAIGVPWALAQLPAALLTAGIYGILEGWLAVDGARDWWPMRPPAKADDVDFGFEADDMTGPGIFTTRDDPEDGDATPPGREPH